MTPSRCLTAGCARQHLERDQRLAASADDLFTDIRLTTEQSVALRELLDRFKALVAESVRLAPVTVPLAADELLPDEVADDGAGGVQNVDEMRARGIVMFPGGDVDFLHDTQGRRYQIVGDPIDLVQTRLTPFPRELIRGDVGFEAKDLEHRPFYADDVLGRRAYMPPKQRDGSCSVCAKTSCDGECCRPD